jgi:hypothetical protein
MQFLGWASHPHARAVTAMVGDTAVAMVRGLSQLASRRALRRGGLRLAKPLTGRWQARTRDSGRRATPHRYRGYVPLCRMVACRPFRRSVRRSGVEVASGGDVHDVGGAPFDPGELDRGLLGELVRPVPGEACAAVSGRAPVPPPARGLLAASRAGRASRSAAPAGRSCSRTRRTPCRPRGGATGLAAFPKWKGTGLEPVSGLAAV